MATVSKPPKICAYCGRTDELTKDHVPPKTIFGKPRPTDLITVVACRECNNANSMDEEYFRLKLCMGEQVGDDAVARNNREVVFRSLTRSQASRLKKSFIADTHRVELRTPSGIYTGTSFAFDVDLERIFRVVAKIVRGLYFHETGRRLDSGYDVDIHSDDTLRDEPAEILDWVRENILNPLANHSPTVIGGGTFLYRFHITEEDPFVSIWAFTFYQRMAFLGLTGLAETKGQLRSP